MMLFSKFKFIYQQITGEIWLRVTAFSILSVLTALVAIALRPFLPDAWIWELGAQSVEPILSIIASSMLAVSTFSLGIMANAIASAARSTTPRATQLLLRDKTSQNIISTFLGSFIFSLVGIITLHMGIYNQGGRIVLLAVTLIVLVVIFTSFIKWIDLLRIFGRIPDTLDRIEEATVKTLQSWQIDPKLGCNDCERQNLDTTNWQSLLPEKQQYVQHIDLQALNAIAKDNDLKIFVSAQPGAFAGNASPLALVNGIIEGDVATKLRRTFTLANERSFEQDPALGFIALTETASRALSPAINDPGTAQDILLRGARIFTQFKNTELDKPKFANLWIKAVPIATILNAFFDPILRDGANILEVHRTMVASLEELAAGQSKGILQAIKPIAQKQVAYIKQSTLLENEKDEVLTQLKQFE